MKINKKNLIILGLAGGIMLFFIGMATYIAMGPSTDTYVLPRQISSLMQTYWNGNHLYIDDCGRFFC